MNMNMNIQVVSTCMIRLCRVSPSTCILYRRQNCRHGYMYALVFATDTYKRIQVARPGYLQADDKCIWCKRGLR